MIFLDNVRREKWWKKAKKEKWGIWGTKLELGKHGYWIFFFNFLGGIEVKMSRGTDLRNKRKVN